MKPFRSWNITPIITVLGAALLIFLIPSFFLSRPVFFAELGVAAVLLGYCFWRFGRFRSDIRRYLGGIAAGLNSEDRRALESSPLPVAVLSDACELVWYNAFFRKEVLQNEDYYGASLSQVFPDLKVSDLSRRYLPRVVCGDRSFAVFAGKLRDEEQVSYVLYCVDNTDLTAVADEFEATRPVVMAFAVDNGDEIMQNMRESERAQLKSRVETLMEDWVLSHHGIFRKCGTNRFLAVLQRRSLEEITAGRFDVLDKVRAVRTPDGVSLTVSIGVGVNDTLQESDLQSRQSLDMAQGRGGDQAAVKTANGYEFYGGLSKSVEKRTKVRTRVVASALQNMILNSERVVLMGHRYSDLDCLGAAAALTGLCRTLGRPAYTVYDAKTTLASVLVERYRAAKKDDFFIAAEDAIPMMNASTLLIVVDTHQPDRVDAPELLSRASSIVVIDHHRKAVDHINNAMLFYHEPYSSSASEMVAELAQYMPDAHLSSLEAESLMAGIMLDTHSFVMRSGVRTFEAAAYVRKLGADTVAVKQMFSESLETYRRKAEIISSAEHYRGTAIACAEGGGTEFRIAAAQAADELLCVKGADASFVLYHDGHGVNISGRSYGALNVQLAMEAIGGGGHQTMAGAYLKDTTVAEARERLCRAIDALLEERNRVRSIQQETDTEQ